MHPNGLVAPFAAVRTKQPNMENMCDLVSFVHEEIGELEKFAMVTWAFWQRRNKLQSKETSTSIHKIYKTTLTLLAEFQLKKPRLVVQGFATPTQW